VPKLHGVSQNLTSKLGIYQLSIKMTVDRQFQVSSGCELLPYLTGLPLGLSRKQAKDLLRFRAVTVKGKATVRHDTELMPGDVVTIAARKQVSGAALERHGLAIVHLDDAVVVVEKPAGLLSMGSEREKEKTAYRILNTHLKAPMKTPAQQVFIVHRLDRETSGLMMFARTESVQAALQRNWKDVIKRYLAVVEGVPADARGTLKDRLVESSKSLTVHRVEEGGELAITHYRVLRAKGARSLLELTLGTGRRNQIRVQLAALGHPVIGDRKYGVEFGVKTDPARRLALHACELKFRHPVSGAPMEFHSALPSRLKALMDARAPR
jgi:23S rRNA pseudouridine1911/1915/1917 synthase